MAPPARFPDSCPEKQRPGFPDPGAAPASRLHNERMKEKKAASTSVCLALVVFLLPLSSRGGIETLFPMPTVCETETPTTCPILTTCPNDPTYCEWTVCPYAASICPDTPTACPYPATRCTWDTRCPEVTTKCPKVHTQCPPGHTYCTGPQTFCHTQSTTCPAIPSECPYVETVCGGPTTRCPAVPTHCPVVFTTCPSAVPTWCPPNPTLCPPTPTHCAPGCMPYPDTLNIHSAYRARCAWAGGYNPRPHAVAFPECPLPRAPF